MMSDKEKMVSSSANDHESSSTTGLMNSDKSSLYFFKSLGLNNFSLNVPSSSNSSSVPSSFEYCILSTVFMSNSIYPLSKTYLILLFNIALPS